MQPEPKSCPRNQIGKQLKLQIDIIRREHRVIPLVILNNAMAFVYAYIQCQCLDGPVNWFSMTFCVLK